ncbi:hypothetical protein A2U01_0117602, partial [Trifolium medium]|nr:hypothetical protein [Trifolium medium]
CRRYAPDGGQKLGKCSGIVSCSCAV